MKSIRMQLRSCFGAALFLISAAVLADFYLNQHRERLLMEATEAIATWPDFAGWRLPPGHEVFVKSAETEHLPMASGCCGQNGQSL